MDLNQDRSSHQNKKREQRDRKIVEPPDADTDELLCDYSLVM